MHNLLSKALAKSCGPHELYDLGSQVGTSQDKLWVLHNLTLQVSLAFGRLRPWMKCAKAKLLDQKLVESLGGEVLWQCFFLDVFHPIVPWVQCACFILHELVQVEWGFNDVWVQEWPPQAAVRMSPPSCAFWALSLVTGFITEQGQILEVML